MVLTAFPSSRDCRVNYFHTGRQREMHETGTHWDFSHQPMDPCTPPAFLKMASHGPSYIVHVYRCRTLCCVFSLLGQKHIRPILLAEEKKVPLYKTIGVSDHRQVEGKHLTVAYAVGKSNCSRNCGTLHQTRVSSHLQFVYFWAKSCEEEMHCSFGTSACGSSSVTAR